jgi:hypothetical protein
VATGKACRILGSITNRIHPFFKIAAGIALFTCLTERCMRLTSVNATANARAQELKLGMTAGDVLHKFSKSALCPVITRLYSGPSDSQKGAAAAQKLSTVLTSLTGVLAVWVL